MDNCKVCGTMMENFEGYDSDICGSEYLEFIRAYCPHCHKWYKWIEVFRFSEAVDFEEDI